MARVTVVNDNPEFLAMLDEVLEEERFESTTVDGDRDDALDLVRASRPDVVIIDLRMGKDELHGWNFAQQLRADPEFGGLPVLICSADLVGLEAIREDLAATRAVATLVKPFNLDDLIAAVDGLLAEGQRR
ncbi:MAG TPA: response regulator [Candidatus Limnocylindria bacterium]|nr:response regulator [Candidatus Limnocylindria bacterium]